MRVVTVNAMRELDRKTIEEQGVPGEVLMERAGRGVARHVQALAAARGWGACPIACFAGKGNNGGDAFVAARVLHEAGHAVEVWLAARADTVRGDAAIHLTRMQAAGVPLHELPEADAWRDLIAARRPDGAILVDGLLGTGITGPARGVAAAAIDAVNQLAACARVVAIDIPSGLDADTGAAPGPAVTADVTVTFGLPKAGLIEPASLEYVGNVHVVDIGLVAADAGVSDKELIVPEDFQGALTRRARASHKGTYGNVLLIGGSADYSGAVILAAAAAVRSGVGLVTALVPDCVAGAGAGRVPEAMFHAGATTARGTLAGDCLTRWGRSPADFDAVMVGPGMTAREETVAIVERILGESAVPVLLDADALNACAGRTQVIREAACPVVVTPHPGEMGRLLGSSAREVQADRHGAVLRAVERLGGTVVLKGAGTLVATQGKPVQVNLSADPGMAKGGMGDVLSGLLAGLLAQGVYPFTAACAAVYVHGRAGTLAALHGSQQGITATDVIDRLPVAFRSVVRG